MFYFYTRRLSTILVVLLTKMKLALLACVSMDPLRVHGDKKYETQEIITFLGVHSQKNLHSLTKVLRNIYFYMFSIYICITNVCLQIQTFFLGNTNFCERMQKHCEQIKSYAKALIHMFYPSILLFMSQLL